MTTLSRRRFVQGAGLASVGLLAGCGRPPLPPSLPWQAPPTSQKMFRIGWLQLFCPGPVGVGIQETFEQGMQMLGYVKGRDYVIEQRCGGDSPAALIEPAGELVRSGVDVILAATASVEAARMATSTLPIVMVYPSDPVATGIIPSLAHPGGNITGLTYFVSQLLEKRLELLRDMVPGLRRVAVMRQGGRLEVDHEYHTMLNAASAMGLQLQPLNMEGPDDFEAAFGAASREGAQGLVYGGGDFFVPYRARIIALAVQHQLPAMYWHAVFVKAGGLISYGPNISAQFRRAAYYVDRILKGAKPADLPVEQPTTFEFVINMQTAKALGLTIPYHVLLQATEVIE